MYDKQFIILIAMHRRHAMHISCLPAPKYITSFIDETISISKMCSRFVLSMRCTNKMQNAYHISWHVFRYYVLTHSTTLSFSVCVWFLFPSGFLYFMRAHCVHECALGVLVLSPATVYAFWGSCFILCTWQSVKFA